MSNLAIFLIALLAFATGGAIGYGVRGWQDGTIVTAKSANDTAQVQADKGAETAVRLVTVAREKEVARERLSAPAPVSHECPPGTGAVSAAALDRLKTQ